MTADCFSGEVWTGPEAKNEMQDEIQDCAKRCDVAPNGC